MQSPNEGDADSQLLERATPVARRRRRRRGARSGADASAITPALRSNIVFGLLGVVLVGSVLAVGTVHVVSLLVVAPLALAAGVLGWPRGAAGWPPLPACVIFGLALVSAVQALPVPVVLTRLVHPTGLGIWESAANVAGVTLRFAPISLDPGASLVEALKWLSYGAVFVAAASVARVRDARWLLALVFGAAVLTALVTLAHRLVGAQSLFGVYQPVFAAPKFATSPLLNANNLAGYLNLGSFAGIGLLVARRLPVSLWPIGLGIAILVGLSAVSGSRAGLVSLLAGVLVAVVLLLRQRRVSRRVVAVLGATLLGGFGLFAIAASRDVWRALFDEGGQKLALISWTAPLVRGHFWTGVGRGAFETAFPAYREDSGHHVYQFAENFVMQWCCEWGVPIAVAALLAFAWLLRPSKLGATESPSSAVAVVGVAVLLGQNLLDLGLEVAAISLALSTLLGGLWGAAEREAVEALPRRELPPFTRFALPAIGLLLWFGVLVWGRNTALVDRTQIAAAVKARSGVRAAWPDPTLMATVKGAVLRHPADPFLPLMGAIVARGNGENAFPWLSRAIERDPMAGRPYLLLAEVLAGKSAKAQALGALRRAVEREYVLMASASRLVVQLTPTWDEMMQSVPEGHMAASMLTALAARSELAQHRGRLLDEAITRDKGFLKARIWRAEDLMRALEQRVDPCAEPSDRCVQQIVDLAADIERVQVDRTEPPILRARVMMATGRMKDALRTLDESCPKLSQAQECYRWHVQLSARARDLRMLESAGTAYLAAACASSSSCAPAASWLGGVFTSVGDDARALLMYERAARELDTAAAWQAVATAAKRLGLMNEARKAEKRGARAGVSRGPVTESLENERER